MTWTISDWAEMFTAIGTILLSIVTVWITAHQNKKAKIDKIENWKDSHLNSHYNDVMREIGEIQDQISPIADPSDCSKRTDFGFQRLHTRRNHWGISNESLLISDNNSSEVKCLTDEDNMALRHIKSGYPALNRKIREINNMEERYKECISGNLQNFIDFLYRECKSEFGEWSITPDVYTPLENTIRIVEPESNKENTPVTKGILISSLADSLIECIIGGATDIGGRKEPFGTKVDSFNISLIFKTENFGGFNKLPKVVAKTVNYAVTDDDLSKFRKTWINLNSEAEKIKKMYEERERIMAKYKELRESLTRDILNRYGAGYRIMGECDVCKLTKDAKEDEIRPYVN